MPRSIRGSPSRTRWRSDRACTALPRTRRASARMNCCARSGSIRRVFAGRYPHELSGGQSSASTSPARWRSSPRLVILDEAVSALDKSVEAQVLNLLIDLKNELGLTYIFISHDLNVIRFISDRIVVMYLGEVVESGPVEAMWDRPAASLYASAVRGDAVAGSRQAHAEAADRRRSAQSDQSAVRLPLPHALRVCRSRLQRDRRRSCSTPAPTGISQPVTWSIPMSGHSARAGASHIAMTRRTPIVEISDLHRALSRRAHRACAQRRRHHARPGRGAGPARRIRLGQERDAARAAAPAAAAPHRHRRARSRSAARTCLALDRRRARKICAAASSR